MNHIVKREGSYATVAVIIVAAGIWLFNSVALPAFNDWRYASSPYAPIENIEMVRDGDKLKFVGDITKIADCDPSGMPPQPIRWRWGANSVATDLIYLNGRPMAARNVIRAGETARVSVLEATVPDEAIQDNLSIAIVVTCDRGDGVPRDYEIEPRLPIN